MLDQFEERDGALIAGNLSSFDRFITYVRLTKIARKQGDNVRAAEYLSVARNACDDAKWSDCSEQLIMDITARIDKKLSIKCLSETG